MVNDEDAPTGRPAGALGWAGLANLFYWIDRKNGIGGFWATQILPFGDPGVVRRLHGFRDRRLPECRSPRRRRRAIRGAAGASSGGAPGGGLSSTGSISDGSGRLV